MTLIAVAALLGQLAAPPLVPLLPVTEPAKPLPGKQISLVTLLDAPATPQSSVLAAVGATATSVAWIIAGVSMLNEQQPLVPEAWIATLVGGAVALNFAPSMGDLLNGEVGRFFGRGAVRLLLLVISSVVALPIPVIGALGVLGWVAWVGFDLFDARNAPDRWVARENARLSGTPWSTGALF